MSEVPSAPPKKILIVDDEVNLLELLKDALENFGYDIRTATDGVVAIKALESFMPDLLVSDARMPGMTGFELVSYLRKIRPELPCVLVSGYAEGLEKRAFAAGVEALFMKPFRLVELLQFIKVLLGDDASRAKRASIRVSCAVEIMAQFGTSRSVLASTLNLSEGGLFILIPDHRMPLSGEIVKFEVFPKGPHEDGIRGHGICRWIRERGDLSAPRGFGLRFEDPSETLTRLTQNLVDSHQINETDWLR